MYPSDHIWKLFEETEAMEEILGLAKAWCNEAYSRSKRFLHLMWEAWTSVSKLVREIFQVQRLKETAWRRLRGLERLQETTAEEAKFVEKFLRLWEILDRKDNQLFFR